MARFLHPIESFTFRRYPRWYLAFSWLLGLGAGGLVFRYAGDNVSLMPLAAAGQPSIVSLFLCTSLPFLLCAFALSLDKPGILLPVCFLRAFFYAYALSGVFCFFEGSGWLIRWLLMFTPTFGCALLYGYAGRHISGLFGVSFWELMGCLLLVAALVLLDCSFVSPLLRQLLS